MRPLPATPVRSLAALLAVLALALAACSSGSSGTPASSAPAGSAAAGGAVTATGAWARPAAADGISAAYVELHNGSSTEAVLTGASSPGAGTVTLHETTTDSGGMTGMHHVPTLSIPAGGTVRLEPGGYHLMLEMLTGELAAGSTIDLVLTFQDGATLDVTAEVRAG